VGCYIWYSEEGTGRGPSPPRPLLAVPNVTAHPSAASVPITVLLYNGPLLCGFNVGINGLVQNQSHPQFRFGSGNGSRYPDWLGSGTTANCIGCCTSHNVSPAVVNLLAEVWWKSADHCKTPYLRMLQKVTVILNIRPDSDQHRNLISSRGSPLAHT